MPFWLIVLVFVATTFAAGLLAARRPRGQDAKPSSIGDFDFPTAEEGRPIPVIFGTVKISAPNVIWYGDLGIAPIRRDGQTIGFKYSVGMQMALCHGPVDDVIALLAGEDDKQVFFTKNTVLSGGFEDYRRLDVNQPDLFGGERDGKEGGIVGRFDFYRGLTTQNASSYLTPLLSPGLNPPYNRLCHVVARRPYLGTSQYLKKLSWVVRRQPSALGLTTAQTQLFHDANPAEIIYDLMVNSIYGLGRDPSDIDTASFATAGARLATEFMGMSLLIETKNAAQKFIDEILQHIDGVVFTDPQTGLWTMALARDDYDPYTLLELTDADLAEPAELTRGSWPETLNEIKVEYIESNGVNRFQKRIEQAHESANHAVQGERFTETIELHGFTRAALAQSAATRELRAASYPLLKGSIKVNRKAWPLRIGQPFRLTTAAAGTEAREPTGTATSHHATTAAQSQSGPSWLNIANALDLDGNSAEVEVLFPDAQSKRLELTDLKLNVPDGADIDGIEIPLKNDTSAVASHGFTVQLLFNGMPVGDAKAINVSVGPKTTVFGGPTDDWNCGLTPAQMRSPSFGISIIGRLATGSQAEFFVDGAVPIVVHYSWPGQVGTIQVPVSVIMRVGPIHYGSLEDSKISIDVVEDIFAHIEEAVFDNPAAGDSDWVDPIDLPIDPLDPLDPLDGLLLNEAPFHLAHSMEILVAAQRRDQTSSSYEVHSDEGAGFYKTNEVPAFCPTARLTAEYSKETDALDLTGFTVDDGIDLDKLESTDAAGRIRGDNLLVIGSEWMSWETITDNGDGTFTIEGIVRGIFDTRPLTHAEDAMVYFVTSGPRSTDRLAFAGLSRVEPFLETQAVDIKALPRNPKGVLDIGDTTEHSITLENRANKPYPPGNLKINGEFFPAGITGDAVVTWSHRNRFELKRQNRVAQQDEGNIGSPEGTYTFEVYLDGVLQAHRTQTGITGTTATYTQAHRNADDPGGTKMVTFKVYDTRTVAPPPVFDPPAADEGDPGGPGGEDLPQIP